jgi:hypothetical protein
MQLCSDIELCALKMTLIKRSSWLNGFVVHRKITLRCAIAALLLYDKARVCRVMRCLVAQRARREALARQKCEARKVQARKEHKVRKVRNACARQWKSCH